MSFPLAAFFAFVHCGGFHDDQSSLVGSLVDRTLDIMPRIKIFIILFSRGAAVKRFKE